MNIRLLEDEFSVGKTADMSGVDWTHEFVFAARTDEECSLVCKTIDMPKTIDAVEHGWRAMRIEGVLDFSLVGIIAKIAACLAQAQISVFVVSTYNTDYILIKKNQIDTAVKVLEQDGYIIKKNEQEAVFLIGDLQNKQSF